MAQATYAVNGSKKNKATTTYTGVNLDGTGKMTNYGDGKFASEITPNVRTYYTGASLSDNSPMQNNGNGKFAATVQINGTNNGGGGGGSLQAAPAQTDPYAGIYSLYEQQLNAQRDALAQQRQARLNALQANYNNAKSRLDSSFSSGETELNQNADRALREAYINNMLNQRALNQSLANQGIVGGAAESVLARAFNNYGNNRNEIERDRMDNLRSLLGNYQEASGNIENAYLQGMADADSDYSGSIADALSAYYDRKANMEAQNIANQYKASLGKSGSSSSNNSSNDGLTSNGLNRKSIVSTLSKFKDDPESAMMYGSNLGLGGDELNDLYWEAGINPNYLGASNVPSSAQRANILASVPAEVKQRLLSYLDNDRGQVYGDDTRLMAALQTYGRQNGLTEEQVRAILAEAGY